MEEVKKLFKEAEEIKNSIEESEKQAPLIPYINEKEENFEKDHEK